MNRIIRLLLLLILGIPAFTGYPLGRFTGEIVPGATWALVGYWLTVTLSLRVLNGRRRHEVILGISVLIALPVVFVGAGVSYLLTLGTGPFGRLGFAYSAHYISLCLTMLTVVPLALSLAAAVPVQALEQYLLRGTGVSPRAKAVLMALRVFNHILFFVIPTILEVVREESVDGRWVPSKRPSHLSRCGLREWRQRCRRLIRIMVIIATEGICSAVQFIPLWAVEIARLPGDGGDHERS